jgi:predicted nucleotidyltransferase
MLAAMPTPDLALVREFKRRAEQTLPGRIVRVMLYGSRARGDARPDSDWDVAVFVKGEPTSDDRSTLSDIGFDLMLESGQYLQTIAIDASRSPEGSYFVHNVLKDGLPA